jgi:hypothetical protein
VSSSGFLLAADAVEERVGEFNVVRRLVALRLRSVSGSPRFGMTSTPSSL